MSSPGSIKLPPCERLPAAIFNRKQFRLLVLAYLTILAAFLLSPVYAYCSENKVKIGVLAYRGHNEAIKMWAPTADYLSRKIPRYSFITVPLDFHEIGPAVEKGLVDFVLTNTSMYVELEALYGVSCIATLKNVRNGGNYTVFGGVIFCRNDRGDIKGIKDLKGKSFMAVEETSLGGWRMAWLEMLRHGIDPYRDLKSLQFGGTHDKVAYAVRDGKVDAGTVRTDTIERMGEEGLIDPGLFRTINQQHADKFPFALSTPLYPEWPFAKVRHTPDDLAQKVAIALLEMPPGSRAAKAAKIAGWTVPLDYQPVHELMKELRIGPYKDFGKITIFYVLTKYWYLFVLSIAIIALMGVAISHMLRLNKQLRQSKLDLEEANANVEKAYGKLQDDIINREKAEEALKRSYNFVKAVLDSISDAISIIDIHNLKIVGANKAFLNEFDIQEKDAIGKTCYEITHRRSGICAPPEDACPLMETIKTGKHALFEHEHHGNHGEIIYAEVSTAPIKNEDGEIIQAIHISRDITERKRMENELKESEEKYRNIFNSSQDGIYFSDKNNVFKLINQAGAEILGHKSPEELIDRPVIDYWLESKDRDILIAELRSRKRVTAHLIRARRATGEEIYVETTSRYIEDKSGNFIGIEGILRDVTVRKLAENELKRNKKAIEDKNTELEKAYNELQAAQSQVLQQEKMASIGQLAAGVAHEINNPMGFIMSNLGSLQKYSARLAEFMRVQSETISELSSNSSNDIPSRVDEQRRVLKIDHILGDLTNLIMESLEGAERVRRIVQDLKNFSRIDEAEYKMADINAGLESTINIVWNELKYKATVKKEYGDVPMLLCNPGQLNQVFMNLLVNAAHAIEKQGEITVKTWNEGEHVCISISDTGCGIPEDKLGRIFEPFFTTKEVGKGTGLGLSIAYDIVKKHKGQIKVDSEVGKGSIFTIKIPAMQKG